MYGSLPSHNELAVEETDLDFYQVLAIPRDAPLADIKTAYRRALLNAHPDKALSNQRKIVVDGGLSLSSRISVSLIQEAYITLSFPESRKQYDIFLLSHAHHGVGSAARPVTSRPAEVVSLEEFTVECSRGEGKPDLNGDSQDKDGWESETYTYPCRCGGKYRLTAEDLENDHHVVGCETCSEVIWAGYEEVVEEEDMR